MKFCFWLCVSCLIFHFSTFAQTAEPNKATVETAAVSDFVKRYYAAYGTGEARNALALWNEQTPDYAVRKREIELFFGAYRISALTDLTIKEMSVENDRAEARVEFRLAATNAKTGERADLPEISRRVLTVATGEQNPRVWDEISAEQELAKKLVSASGENEQNALLDAFKELVNNELRRAVAIEANRLRLDANYNAAIANFELSRRIAERLNDQTGVGIGYNNIGVVYNDMGQYQTALEYYEKSLQIKRALNDKVGVANSDNNIGLILVNTGNYPLALERLTKAGIAAQELGDTQGEAYALGNSAIAYRRLGNYEQAERHQEDALRLYEQLGDQRGAAGVYLGIGLLRDAQQNHEAAREFYLKGLALSEAAKDKSGVAAALSNLGFNRSKTDNHHEALEYYEKSLKISEEIKNLRRTAVALMNVAAARLALGQPEAALAAVDRALIVAQQTNSDFLMIEAEAIKGAVLRRLKQFEPARLVLQKPLTKSKRPDRSLSATRIRPVF